MRACVVIAFLAPQPCVARELPPHALGAGDLDAVQVPVVAQFRNARMHLSSTMSS